ncbi:hypothetical protein THAOC_33926 [Thalassiosira oceanica]|uniref:Uncharacterized protein n=1 Tax=Thalassiosira oceanica TaxID=159749 RepID=K0RE70_THAOC|nr:hypothetical protein THAOC_33926 [Thalassiosira oceanica]|eukprot:EJK47356.1 hypothetical protein THAOC_33926 [Thalassiosira oceanica]
MSKNDIQGIHLRLREADGIIPRLLRFQSVMQMSSDLSYGVACIVEISLWKVGWLIKAATHHGGPEDSQRQSTEKQAKLGFPTFAGGRRRLGMKVY